MKYPKRSTRITYEGVSFMSVLAFIILGSIIRQINLLVLLSGLMIAPFFFNWRISMKMMERLRAKRQLPDWVHAAKPFSVRWQISNDRVRIPAWGVRVIDRIRKAGESDFPKSRKARGDTVEEITVMAAPIPAGSTLDATYRCFLPARGVYEFGHADISTAFPVGLVRSKIKQPIIQRLVVAPRLGQLTRSWNSMVVDVHEGQRPNQRRRSDHDGEFHAIRPWMSGDSRRQVHWRSSARHGELMVRQLEQNSAEQLFLVLDFHDHGSLANEQAEFALSFFTTVLAKIAQGTQRGAARSRGKVSVGIYGNNHLLLDRLDRHSIQQAMACMAELQPSNESTSLDLPDQIRIAANASRSRVVAVSTRGRHLALGKEGTENVRVRWIDLSLGEGKKYFRSLPDTTGDFIHESVEDPDGVSL